MRERVALSIPTQTAMKGLRDAAKILPCRSAVHATFSKSILGIFVISGIGRTKT
jgi:hypothetical protein